MKSAESGQYPRMTTRDAYTSKNSVEKEATLAQTQVDQLFQMIGFESDLALETVAQSPTHSPKQDTIYNNCKELYQFYL